jgi:hypothetical protein
MPAELTPSWLAAMVKPAPPKVATHAPVACSTTGGTPWGSKGRDDELEAVRTAVEHRNDQLNESTFACAQLHAGGEIPDCRDDLITAGLAAGLGENETRKTVESAWRAGMNEPRMAPPRGNAPTSANRGNAMTETSTTEEVWSALKPLTDDLLPVPAFDHNLLPDSILPWAVDSTDRMQCPPEFFVVPAMVAAATLIGRTVTLRPKQHDSYSVVSNPWGMGIGGPGTMKTPAADEAFKPLKMLQAEAFEKHKSDLEQYERRAAIRSAKKTVTQDKLKKQLRNGVSEAELLAAMSDDAAVDEPHARRVLLNDVTPEKAIDIATQNPRGFAVVRDELAGLFRSFTRDGHEAERTMYLEGANGNGSFSIDRIGRGTTHVAGFYLTVFGTIQEDVLAPFVRESSKLGDDGLIARFGMMVMPDVGGWRHVDREPDREARDRAYSTYRRLDAMTAASVGAVSEYDGLPFLRYSPDAQFVADEWIASLMPQIRSGTASAAVRSHIAKYTKLQPALALLCHLMDSRGGPVSLTATQRSIAWCDFLRAHAERIYAYVEQSSAHTARSLLEKIRAGKVTSPFTLKSVYSHDWTGLTDMETVAKAAECLSSAGYIRESVVETSRRPRREWHVNPAVLRGEKPLSVITGVPEGIPGRDIQSHDGITEGGPLKKDSYLSICNHYGSTEKTVSQDYISLPAVTSQTSIVTHSSGQLATAEEDTPVTHRVDNYHVKAVVT